MTLRSKFMPPGVDEQKTFDEAHRTSMHLLYPEDVLLHGHSMMKPCDGQSHAFFKAEVGRLEGDEGSSATKEAVEEYKKSKRI